MPKFKDHTGERFGHYIVLRHEIRETKYGKAAYWLCRCDCGNEKWVSANNLVRGNCKSCGCKRTDVPQSRPNPLKANNPRLYSIWTGMKTRCNNPNSSRYKDYGGRGISICDSWLVFDNFCLWALDNGYKDGLTIERVNNDNGYNPDNCIWITNECQAKNKRNNRLYTYNGETRHLAEWARLYNMDYSLLYDRLSNGMSFDKAISVPKKTCERIPSINPDDDERTKRNKREYQKFIVLFDEKISETKIARKVGLSPSSLQKWKKGKSHPTKEHMETIISYLGVSEGYFENN